MDVDGVVHWGLLYSRDHIVCDHEWVEPVELRYVVVHDEPVTCLWCVAKLLELLK